MKEKILKLHKIILLMHSNGNIKTKLKSVVVVFFFS